VTLWWWLTGLDGVPGSQVGAVPGEGFSGGVEGVLGDWEDFDRPGCVPLWRRAGVRVVGALERR